MAEQTIREKVAEEVKEGFQTAVTTISSHTRDVLGSALGGLVEDFKNISSSIIGVLGSGFGSIFGMFSVEEKQLDEQERQTGLLKGLLNYFKREQKEDLRDPDGSTNIIGTPGAIMAAILAFVGALAFGLGGMVGAILKPFQVLVKGLYPLFAITKWFGKIFSGIFSIIKGLPGIRNIVSGIGRFVNWIKGIMSTVKSLPVITKITNLLVGAGNAMKSLFSPILKYIKSTRLFATIIAKFAKGFSYGSPIAIILGVIDFFIGFFKSEGTIIERIKAGLVNVVQQFLYLPTKLLGWISDWVLGMFGIEIEGGSAKKIMQGIEWAVNASIKAIVGIFKEIVAPIKWVIDSIKWISGKITSLVKFLISPLQSIVSGYWNIIGNIKDKIGSMFSGVMSKIGDIDITKIPSMIFKGITHLVTNIIPNIFSGLFSRAKEALSNIKDIGIWNTVAKYWDTIKEKFISLIEKLNPLNWFKLDEIKIDGPLEKALEMIMNIGEKIKSFIVSTIKGIVNKIPKILLPKSVEKWSGNEMDKVFEEKPTRVYRKAVTRSPVSDMEREGKKREIEEKAKEKRDNKKLQEQDKKMMKEMQRSQQTSNNQWQSTMNQFVNANQEKGKNSETETPDQIEHFGLIYMNTPTMGTSH